MHLTHRQSGWRFQIRVPCDLEDVFGRSPIRLKLGPIGKRNAARTARLLAGHAESVFLACRKGASMTKDELIEELQAMLLSALDNADATIQALEKSRELEVKSVTLNLLTERLAEQEEFGQRMEMLNGRMNGLVETIKRLPARERDALSDQVTELSALVRQSLAGGPDRPLALAELERWTELRWGHADDKKVRTDRNRITDFVDFAGNRPVNRYRYSDFQGFANLLARTPSNYSKEPRLRNMTRQQAADYNDSLPPDRRFDRLSETAIDSNYFSPLRMFFGAMAAEHEFRNPLGDAKISIPRTATKPKERSPFTVDELNIWFTAAAKEIRADLKWLPPVATVTGARIAELIFLQGKDVFELQPGLWVADIATDLVFADATAERPVKNEPSRRLFALHEVLREIGFIDYCRARKPDEWIFPAAFYYGKERVKDPASAASKRHNNRLAKLGIHKPHETTFHSTRHTAKDIMRVAKVDPRTADRQTGHAMKSVADDYGSRRLRVDEVEVLAALPLPEGLDWSPYIQN